MRTSVCFAGRARCCGSEPAIATDKWGSNKSATVARGLGIGRGGFVLVRGNRCRVDEAGVDAPSSGASGDTAEAASAETPGVGGKVIIFGMLAAAVAYVTLLVRDRPGGGVAAGEATPKRGFDSTGLEGVATVNILTGNVKVSCSARSPAVLPSGDP